MNTDTSEKKRTSMVCSVAIGMLIGGILTYFTYSYFAPLGNNTLANMPTDEKEPLYWVAPMDANFKRDKAGKSPMGMDLVPVYDDGGKGPDEGPGTIRISPEVINNLGVRTSLVSYKPLNSKINTVGYITYNEDKLVNIHPRVKGWIEKLYVKAVGDPIKKNQPLYDIYSPELVNAQKELLLALSRNNKQLLVAAENRLAALNFSLVNINTLKKDKRVQQRVTFYAPQQGVVKQLDIREGFYVKPETMMLSIADLSEVWVKAEVFEREAAKVAIGNKVSMSLDYLPNKMWEGSIEHIHPMINPQTRTAIVRLRFDNHNLALKPNMFAQIAINTAEGEQALLIPKEALIRTGYQNRVVLALGEGNFKSIAVSVGRYNGDSVEILQGLNEGDSVVSSAQFLLDSESSKSSDFKRMNYEAADSTASAPSSVWVQAQIVDVMSEDQMLKLTHEPIPEWDWPEMTMHFTAADSVDLSLLETDLSLRVEVTKTEDGDYQVINIDIPVDKVAMPVDHSHH